MWLAMVTLIKTEGHPAGCEFLTVPVRPARCSTIRIWLSCGGLAPVLALARRCGLEELVAAKVRLTARGGVSVRLEVPALVAGMVAGGLDR